MMIQFRWGGNHLCNPTSRAESASNWTLERNCASGPSCRKAGPARKSASIDVDREIRAVRIIISGSYNGRRIQGTLTRCFVYSGKPVDTNRPRHYRQDPSPAHNMFDFHNNLSGREAFSMHSRLVHTLVLLTQSAHFLFREGAHHSR